MPGGLSPGGPSWPGGSVTDPQKGYHLELATTHLRVSRELHTLLLELGYTTIQSLAGADPEEMYARECARKGVRVDRCVLYVYAARSITRPPRSRTRRS